MKVLPGDYILGVWFVQGPQVNWMCSFRKREGTWQGEYRFRYERIADPVINTPFSDLDEKSWYTIQLKDECSEKELKETTMELAELLAKTWESQVQFVPVGGGADELFAALETQPWAHIKVRPSGVAP